MCLFPFAPYLHARLPPCLAPMLSCVLCLVSLVSLSISQMTLEKFNKLSVTFMDVGLPDPKVVAGVIDMIVDKAQMEPHFSR